MESPINKYILNPSSLYLKIDIGKTLVKLKELTEGNVVFFLTLFCNKSSMDQGMFSLNFILWKSCCSLIFEYYDLCKKLRFVLHYENWKCLIFGIRAYGLRTYDFLLKIIFKSR